MDDYRHPIFAYVPSAIGQPQGDGVQAESQGNRRHLEDPRCGVGVGCGNRGRAIDLTGDQRAGRPATANASRFASGRSPGLREGWRVDPCRHGVGRARFVARGIDRSDEIGVVRIGESVLVESGRDERRRGLLFDRAVVDPAVDTVALEVVSVRRGPGEVDSIARHERGQIENRVGRAEVRVLELDRCGSWIGAASCVGSQGAQFVHSELEQRFEGKGVEDEHERRRGDGGPEVAPGRLAERSELEDHGGNVLILASGDKRNGLLEA